MSVAADNPRKLVAHLSELRIIESDIVHALNSELDRLQRECKKKEAEIERLISAQSQLGSNLEISKRQNQDALEKVSALENEIAQLRESYGHVLNQIEGNTDLVEGLKKKFALTVQKIKADFEQEKNLLSSQFQNDRAKLESRTKTLDALQFKLAKIGSFSEDQSEQINALSKKLAEANSTISRLTGANHSLQSDNARFQESLSKSQLEIENAIARVVHATENAAQERQGRELAEKTASELRIKSDELFRQVGTLHSQLTEKDQQFKSFKTDSQITFDSMKRELLSAHSNKLQEEQSRHESHLLQLTQQLNEEKLNSAQLKSELGKKQATAETAEKEKIRAEQLLMESKNEFFELEQRLTLREHALQEERKSLQNDVLELKRTLEVLADENERLKIQLTENQTSAESRIKELQLRDEYREAKTASRESQIAIQEKQIRLYSHNLMQQKRSFLKDMQHLVEAITIASQILPSHDGQSKNESENALIENFEPTTVDAFHLKVRVEKLSTKSRQLDEFFRLNSRRLNELGQLMNSALREVSASIETDSGREQSEIEVLEKKLEDLHVENMRLKSDLTKAQFDIRTQEQENGALKESREATLATQERHIHLREMQLKQYTQAITEQKAEFLRHAKILADEVSSFSKMHPLKDYLRMTEFELSRAEVQLKSTPALSVDRKKFEKLFENLLEQKKFLIKVIGETEAKLASQSQQLLDLVRSPKLNSSPALPPPFLPKDGKVQGTRGLS